MDNVWFTPDRVFSYNAMLNFVVGERGCGKTYGTKKWAIKHFLKTGKQFIYLRRYKDELKNLYKFFDTLKYDEELRIHDMQIKGRIFYIDGLEMGHADILSTQQNRKGTEEPNVDTILFDEFIIEKGMVRYLPDEVSKLLGYMDSVFRNREGCRCICLANAISWVNPYFIFYKFYPMKEGYQVVQEGTVLLNVYKNETFSDMREQTTFAKMVKGTVYAEMALDNKFSDVNDDFIKKRGKTSNLMFNIAWKDKIYGVWADNQEFNYVVSEKYNPDMRTICYSTKDYKPNMMLLTDKKNRINQELKRAFTNGFLFYESVYIRNDMFDMFTIMGLR